MADVILTELYGLAGKVALVTGGTRGIGRMIATGYVRAGAKFYISSRYADERGGGPQARRAHRPRRGHRLHEWDWW